jgi:hypothetical protein
VAEAGALAALEVVMNRNLARDCTTLGDEILKSYVRAVREQQPKVAEQLLGALEELARADSACCVVLDQAYLLIGRVAASRCSGRTLTMRRRSGGRVIRTQEDKGVVYLIDDRFARPAVQQLLPSWWRVLGASPSTT